MLCFKLKAVGSNAACLREIRVWRLRRMLKIKQLDHVVLRVTNLQAMMHFYIDVLGCTLEKVQEKIGLWQLRAGTR